VKAPQSKNTRHNPLIRIATVSPASNRTKPISKTSSSTKATATTRPHRLYHLVPQMTIDLTGIHRQREDLIQDQGNRLVAVAFGCRAGEA